jgi:hypothetical protein
VAVSPTVVAERKKTLVQILQSAARSASTALQKELGYSCDLEFIKDRFDPVNSAYFRAVASFKQRHGFPPDKRITGAKIAAITMHVTLTTRAVLFRSKTKSAHKTHIRFCYFSYFLFLIKTFVMKDEIANPADLMALVNGILDDPKTASSDAVLETLCLYTDALYRGAKRPVKIWAD